MFFSILLCLWSGCVCVLNYRWVLVSKLLAGSTPLHLKGDHVGLLVDCCCTVVTNSWWILYRLYIYIYIYIYIVCICIYIVIRSRWQWHLPALNLQGPLRAASCSALLDSAGLPVSLCHAGVHANDWSMHMQMHRAHARMKSPSYPSPPLFSQPPPPLSPLTCHSSTLYFLYFLYPTIDD